MLYVNVDIVSPSVQVASVSKDGFSSITIQELLDDEEGFYELLLKLSDDLRDVAEAFAPSEDD